MREWILPWGYLVKNFFNAKGVIKKGRSHKNDTNLRDENKGGKEQNIFRHRNWLTIINPFLTISLCHLTLYPMCPAKTMCQLLGCSLTRFGASHSQTGSVDASQCVVSTTGSSGISVGSQLPQWAGHLCLSPLYLCSKKTQLLWVTTISEVTEGLSAGSWSGTAHVPHASFRGASAGITLRLGWVWRDCVICQQTSGWTSQES